MWCFILFLVAVSSYGVEAYKAAVVHYYPTSRGTPKRTILKNIDEYRKFATKARRKDVDIVVFPEYGLVTTDGLATPDEYSVEIGDNVVCEQLSAIARDNRLYLVVNLFEKIQDKVYNSDLVFDRNGTIIAKYHKMHLFNEDGLNPGAPNQNNTFHTDFGVTFGIFTCFDILFLDPSSTVLRKINVTDVVFVTGWLPSYISLSIEQGYAVANSVNLLAANYGRSLAGRSGTGIYLSDGRSSSIVSDSFKSVLVVKEVPQKRDKVDDLCPQKATKNVKTVSTDKKYIFRDLDLSQKRVRTKICNHHFCCSFDVRAKETDASDIYKLMLFDDSVHYQSLKSNFNICSLLACQNSSINSCGAMTKVATKFQKVAVTGHFTSDNSTFHRPITLSTALSPLRHISYCHSESAVQLRSMNQKDVLVFGIFQRQDSVVEEVSDFPNFQNFVMLFWGRPYSYPLFT